MDLNRVILMLIVSLISFGICYGPDVVVNFIIEYEFKLLDDQPYFAEIDNPFNLTAINLESMIPATCKEVKEHILGSKTQNTRSVEAFYHTCLHLIPCCKEIDSFFFNKLLKVF
uniref:Uncharacterized protein n=1 Tax=Romanomermis culicivorax TaxID=13658 RepID=A0A915I4K6_ROMCU